MNSEAQSAPRPQKAVFHKLSSIHLDADPTHSVP